MSGSAPLVEPAFEKTWGVVMALNLASAVFNGCIIMQACTYFQKFFHRDRFILKCMVAFIWFGCTIFALCEFWFMHAIIITGYDRPHEQVIISLGFPISLAVAVTTDCAMQGIYVLRMYRFSHNRYLLACCCVLMGVEVGVGFVWVGQVAHAITERELIWMVTTTYTVCAVLDIFIAVSMCYQLWRSRMMGLKRTRRLVDKLMRWTIQTGALTSIVSLAIVLMVNLNKKNNFSIGFLLPITYAMGLLALLNARTSLDELGTDHLCLPTATTSLAWARTSKSAGVPATRSALTGSTQEGMAFGGWNAHEVQIALCEFSSTDILGETDGEKCYGYSTGNRIRSEQIQAHIIMTLSALVPTFPS
ncbi:hypothetical protein BD779DRAFT_1474645 [Infundibulicybe gibba]|nr:hypothetical protein BD779DRAFT_1474645 [Infundibulicybe gibba]